MLDISQVVGDNIQPTEKPLKQKTSLTSRISLGKRGRRGERKRGRSTQNMYLHVNLLGMFQDADNVSHDSNAHLLQVFL